MATIELSLSAIKNKTTGRQQIRIRFYHGRINLRAKSGIFILDNPAYWDGHKMVDTRRTNDEERRYHNECRAKLESMCKAIDEAWQQAQGGDIPKDWLKKQVSLFLKPKKNKDGAANAETSITLLKAITKFIDEAPTRILESGARKGQPVSPRTIMQYRQMQSGVVEFLHTQKVKDLKIQDLNKEFYDQYVMFLNSKGYKLNNVGKHIKNLKAVINWLPLKQRIDCEFVAPRKCPKLAEEVDNVYLSTEELQKIQNVELKQDYLDRVRDQFILLAWTGCRYSDLDKLADPESMERGYFELEQKKTGTKVCIPVFPAVRSIFEKYNGVLPSVISNQKFNVFLKEICKLAGIDSMESITHTIGGKRVKETSPKYELVSAHTARRSFATNMFESGAPALVIMQITGHKTEKAFLSYIKTDPETYARMLIDQWNRSQQQKGKQ